MDHPAVTNEEVLRPQNPEVGKLGDRGDLSGGHTGDPATKPGGDLPVEPVNGQFGKQFGEQFGEPVPQDINSDILLTPIGPPLTRAPTQSDGVHISQYANADVLELEINGQIVMRRINDGALNATQLLKTAGLDRSKRQKVLESFSHEWLDKVKGGTGKYQGTWVHLDTANSLAAQYGLIDQLKPLLEFDLSTLPELHRPSQEDYDRQRQQMAQHRNQAKDEHIDGLVPPNDPEPIETKHNSLQSPIMQPQQPVQQIELDSLEDLITLPPLEPQEGDALAELSRDIVTELFLGANRGHPQQLTDIIELHGSPQIETDVPIDDAGHTALHWAAALGKVALVADLVNHGANCRRGNRRGESPLVRAVLVTNSSDTQTFGQLLDLLFPCLHLGDAQGRTVLHHIALTAGIPGRSDASRYYFDALLEWAVRCHGASGVKWLVDELVDVQDANGDTALNIAARLGSRLIAQQLVDIGASVDLPNRAGLRPTDFGITGRISSVISATHTDTLPDINEDGLRVRSTPADLDERRDELRERLLAKVDQIDSAFKLELNAKEATLQDLHVQLREASDKMERLESRKRTLQQRNVRLQRAKKRIAALESAAQTENSRFEAECEQLGDLPTTEEPEKFDADQPFRVTNEEEARKLPPVLLNARLAAYQLNMQQLQQLKTDLERSSLDGEAKYRQVVSQCTSNDVSKVDDILDDLLMAVSKGDSEIKKVAL